MNASDPAPKDGLRQFVTTVNRRRVFSLPVWRVRPKTMAHASRGLALGLILHACPAAAQTVAGDTFADAGDGAKVQVASGFVCPAKIGLFERDAVGESNPETGSDFCAYSALDGLYGTVTLIPVHGAYDAALSLADDFAEQEGTGGKKIAEATIDIRGGGQAAPLAVYTRTYETAKLEDLHYRVTFSGALVGDWAVQTTLEYAEPRDTGEAQQFLRAVYLEARAGIGRTR